MTPRSGLERRMHDGRRYVDLHDDAPSQLVSGCAFRRKAAGVGKEESGTWVLPALASLGM